MSRRTRGRDVSGILLLDKPVGISSNGAMQKARVLFGARKAGHTGNLDVPASGLLPVCLGEATKITPFLLDAAKRYRARVVLGERTDTGDAAGNVIERRPVPALAAEEVEAVLRTFTGVVTQTPPMYSALKHQGRRLYELAAKGVTVERAPRNVVLHEVKLLSFAGEAFEIEVACSKGTYIRTLAEDVAAALRTCGRVDMLRRLQVGPFSIEDACSPEALADRGQGEALDVLLIPMDRALERLPAVSLGEEEAFSIRRGQAVRTPVRASGPVRLYGPGREFLGIGGMLEDGRVAPRRLLRQDAG